MVSARLDRSVFRDPSWWHWVATIPLLILHLSGVSWAVAVAGVLCVAATAYFLKHTRAFKPYPVQIRLAYLVWMLVGLLPGMGWMHWIQLAGTSAMVTVGYCPLARLLNLMPLNRSGPLTWALIGRSFFRDPCAGGLVHWSVEAERRGGSCSIQTPSVGASCSLCNRSPVQKNQRAAAR